MGAQGLVGRSFSLWDSEQEVSWQNLLLPQTLSSIPFRSSSTQLPPLVLEAPEGSLHWRGCVHTAWGRWWLLHSTCRTQLSNFLVVPLERRNMESLLSLSKNFIATGSLVRSLGSLRSNSHQSWCSQASDLSDRCSKNECDWEQATSGKQ